MSETQVSVGTIISPPLGNKFFKIVIEIILAEDPELQKTLYFTPSHLDQTFSKNSTFFDCVKIIFFFLKN